jgi:hypothetical protein
VLEWIGDEEARGLLRELAMRGAGTAAGEQAEAVVARLGK